jgi:hypothetical protein
MSNIASVIHTFDGHYLEFPDEESKLENYFSDNIKNVKHKSLYRR